MTTHRPRSHPRFSRPLPSYMPKISGALVIHAKMYEKVSHPLGCFQNKDARFFAYFFKVLTQCLEVLVSQGSHIRQTVDHTIFPRNPSQFLPP